MKKKIRVFYFHYIFRVAVIFLILCCICFLYAIIQNRQGNIITEATYEPNDNQFEIDIINDSYLRDSISIPSSPSGRSRNSNPSITTPFSLSEGNVSEDVPILCERLNRLGFWEFDLYKDNVNSAIRDAIDLFNRVNHSIDESSVNESIVNRIYSSDNHEYKIRLGDSGEDIALLQQRLKEFSLYGKRINGYYGNQTEKAVKEAATQNIVLGVSKCVDTPRANSTYINSNKLILTAMNKLGSPYKRYNYGPERYDMAGFIVSCMNECVFFQGSLSLSGLAAMEVGTLINDKSILMPGDIIFAQRNTDEIIAAGIYTNNGKIMYASVSASSIIEIPFNDSLFNTYFSFARRICYD